MTFFGRSVWFTLGGVVVATFLLFADDLNDWFYRRSTVEYPKTEKAVRNAEAVASRDKAADGSAADAAAPSSSVVAHDRAPGSRGQDSHQSTGRASQAELPARAPERPADDSSAQFGRDAVADHAKVDEAAKSNAKATEQTAQREHARAVVANADAKADSAKADEAAKSNDKVAEQAAQREQQAQAPSQPLERAPVDAPKGDVVANADTKADSAKADEAAKSNDKAAEQAAQREQQAQAPSQPLERAPVDAPKGDVVANADTKADSAKADEAAKSNDKVAEHAAQREQQAQAPSQPLERAPVDAPRGDVVANADAKADSAKADEAAKSNDKAAEQTAGQREQPAESTQKDVVAQAPSQPLERAPVEAPKGDVVANVDAKADSAKADEAAKLNDRPTEQTAQKEQPAEPAQKEVLAQPPERAPAEALKGDAGVRGSVRAEAPAGSNDVTSAEKTASQREQRAEPVQKDVTAQAPSQPIDQAPAEAPKRDAVAKADAQASGAKTTDAAKSADMAAAEQTSNLRSQQGEPPQKDVTAKAPSQPLAGGPAEAPGRVMPQTSGGDRWVISETTSPLDYTPMVTASILLQAGTSRMKLSIYCRRGRTDLELASDGADAAATGSVRDIVVTHSINQDASIAQRWDVRGPVASFKGDAVAFLRSLPDHGELAVRISDNKSLLHEGRFVLDGLRQVRDKLATACRWPEAATASPPQEERGNRRVSKKGRTQ